MGFYCDNCGRKVERECNECPFCGVLFKAVKCPSCDFSGPSALFTNGCPSCGYLADGSPGKSVEKRVSGESKRSVFSRIPDRFFWITGFLLLLSIPFLLVKLLK